MYDPAYGEEGTAGGEGLPMVGSMTGSRAGSKVGGGSVGSQRRRSLPSGNVLQENPEGLVSEAPLAEDFIHEILAVNTLAMQRTKVESLEEAMNILNEAYSKLNQNGTENIVTDPQMLDQLRATTLNNMGVSEYKRGQPRQALSHFEGSRQLEEKWNVASPSVALNTCAAYNMLRMYDKATAAALETIDMLRTLEVQKKRAKRLEQQQQQGDGEDWPVHLSASTSHSSSKRNVLLASGSTPPAATTKQGRKAAKEEDAELEAAGHPNIAHSDNAALWAAAWHNLGVAQLNSAKRSTDQSEYSNALSIFENAMRTTMDKLGENHPMTKDVAETFRQVRQELRKKGAFKPHRTMKNAPVPPVDPRLQQLEEMAVEPKDGESKHRAIDNRKKDLTITFRGDVTGGKKMTERVDPTPYPGALDEDFKQKKKKKRNGGGYEGLPFNRTLVKATMIYGNPHPLLRSGVGANDPAWTNGDVPDQPYRVDHTTVPQRAGGGSGRPHGGQGQGGHRGGNGGQGQGSYPQQPQHQQQQYPQNGQQYPQNGPYNNQQQQQGGNNRGGYSNQPNNNQNRGGDRGNSGRRQNNTNNSGGRYPPQQQHYGQQGNNDPRYGYEQGNEGYNNAPYSQQQYPQNNYNQNPNNRNPNNRPNTGPQRQNGGGSNNQSYGGGRQQQPQRGGGGRGENIYGSEIPDSKRTGSPMQQQQQQPPRGGRLPPLSAQEGAGRQGSPQQGRGGMEGYEQQQQPPPQQRGTSTGSAGRGSQQGKGRQSQQGPVNGREQQQPHGGMPQGVDGPGNFNSTNPPHNGRDERVGQAPPQLHGAEQNRSSSHPTGSQSQAQYQQQPQQSEQQQQQQYAPQQHQQGAGGLSSWEEQPKPAHRAQPAGPIGYEIGGAPHMTPEAYEQSKFLLLAQPPITSSMSTNYFQLALDPPPGLPRAGAPQKTVQLIGGYDGLDAISNPPAPQQSQQYQQQQQERPQQTPGYSGQEGDAAGTDAMRPEWGEGQRSVGRSPVPTEDIGVQQTVPLTDATTQMSPFGLPAEGGPEPEGPHELFGAMWVVADNRFIRKGKRHLDRPKYYVNAVLNVEEDGTASAYVAEEDRAGGAAGGQLAEPKTAMMVYSGDSSNDNSRAGTPLRA